jgi:putative addiction module killer protein
VIEVLRTAVFDAWLSGLRDGSARARIEARLRRVTLGNLGDVKAVGQGVSELRIDAGPGYRIYFTRIGARVLLLLVGGSEASQRADVRRAQQMVESLNDR